MLLVLWLLGWRVGMGARQNGLLCHFQYHTRSCLHLVDTCILTRKDFLFWELAFRILFHSPPPPIFLPKGDSIAIQKEVMANLLISCLEYLVYGVTVSQL